jgi:DNA-binding NarL/FixJ family response regulator
VDPRTHNNFNETRERAVSIRILLVDDFELWRDFVRFVLKNDPELHIVCEASDGLAAVHNASELKPDLILLDIGLPKLDGISAARLIRTVAPESKILFLSQESSAEVVQVALTAGIGFVVKTDACTELIYGLRGALLGKPFLSSSLAGHTFDRAAEPIAKS